MQAKIAATKSGRTFTKFVEDSLRETLADRPSGRARRNRFEVKPFQGNGLRPGVELDSYANLLDFMERR